MDCIYIDLLRSFNHSKCFTIYVNIEQFAFQTLMAEASIQSACFIINRQINPFRHRWNNYWDNSSSSHLEQIQTLTIIKNLKKWQYILIFKEKRSHRLCFKRKSFFKEAASHPKSTYITSYIHVRRLKSLNLVPWLKCFKVSYKNTGYMCLCEVSVVAKRICFCRISLLSYVLFQNKILFYGDITTLRISWGCFFFSAWLNSIRVSQTPEREFIR